MYRTAQNEARTTHIKCFCSSVSVKTSLSFNAQLQNGWKVTFVYFFSCLFVFPDSFPKFPYANSPKYDSTASPLQRSRKKTIYSLPSSDKFPTFDQTFEDGRAHQPEEFWDPSNTNGSFTPPTTYSKKCAGTSRTATSPDTELTGSEKAGQV